MADAPVVNIGQNSPERIAYLLMIDALNGDKVKSEDRTKKVLLDTYAECLQAVRGSRRWEK